MAANASDVGVGSGGLEGSQGNDNQNIISSGPPGDSSSEM